MTRSTTSRSLHDLGLAAWFGGTLAGAVALIPAAGLAATPQSTGQVATTGWDRWTPVNAAAIGAHLIGSIGQLTSNDSRVREDPQVRRMAVVKTTLTATALAATGYSRLLGRRLSHDHDGAIPAESATQPAAGAPRNQAEAQRRLAILQWTIPALTGALVIVSAFAGEQQRDTTAPERWARRLTPQRGRIASR